MCQMPNLSFVPETISNLAIVLADNPQPDYDGGILGHLFDTNLTFGGNDSAQFWSTYAFQTVHKGTYLLIITVGFMWALLLPSLYILVFCSFHYRKSWCIRPHHTTWKSEEISKNTFRKILTKFNKYLFRPAPRKIRIKEHLKSSHYRQQILLIIFLIISLIFCCFMLVINGHFDFILRSKTDSNSIQHILTSFSASIQDFIQNVIKSFRSKVLTILAELRPRISSFTRAMVSNFMDQLLNRLEINALFSSAQTLFAKFAMINNATLNIIKTKTDLTKSLAIYDNNLKQFRESFKVLPSICPTLPTDYQSQCWQFQSSAKESDFYSVFSPDKIDIRPAEALLTMLNRFKINLTQIESELFNAKYKIVESTSALTEDVMKLLQDENVLSLLDPIMIQIYGIVSPFLNEINSVSESQSTRQYLSYLSISRGLLFVLPGSMFLLIFCVICYFSYKSITFFRNESINTDITDSEAHIMNHSEGASSSASSLSRQNLSLHQFHNHKLSRPCLHYSLIIIALFIIISTLGILAFFIAGSIIQTELCRYLTVAKGVEKLDKSIDIYVSDQWDDWMTQLRNISRINVTSVAQVFTVSDFLHIDKPNHPYTSILSECQAENVGLLDALEMHDVVDIKGFIYSAFMNDLLRNQKTFVTNEVNKIQPQNLLAGSQGILDQMKEAKRLTEDFIDSVDHTDNIQEVSKPLLNMPDPVSFFFKFSNFMKSILTYIGSDTDKMKLYIRSLDMNDLKGEYNSALYSKDHVIKNSLLVLQNERNMTYRLGNLTIDFLKVSSILANISNVVTPVAEIYDSLMEPIKSEAYSIASRYLPELEKGLIPCHKIVVIYNLLEEKVCINFNQEFNSFNIVYIVFLLFFEMTLLLFYFQLREIERCCNKVEGLC